MAGTRIGGKAAAITNRQLYGEDMYATIGQIGGSWRGKKGFATNRDLAVRAGSIGGKLSRRGKRGDISRAKRKPVECKYCMSTSHLTYACKLRERLLARRRVEQEQQADDRQSNAAIARKWAQR
jgi:hypothetical protein